MCGGGGWYLMGPEVSYHGFRLQRHISDEATVITYKAADGSLKRMAVLDAKFRSVQKFGVGNMDVPELDSILLPSGAQYVAGTTAIPNKSPMPDGITSDSIFAKWADLMKADKTARENCDIWMKYNNISDGYSQGVPAIAWCRSQLLKGVGCDLGNAYQNMVIFACGDKLDEMDRSALTHSDLKLGYTSTAYDGTYGRGQRVGTAKTTYRHTSTESIYCSVINVCHDGQVCIGGTNRHSNYSVIPILELD